MTRFQSTLLVLTLTLLGAFASREGLKKRPLTFFLLGGASHPEAFRVKASLGGGETLLEPVVLDKGASQRAREILGRKDPSALRDFAREMGGFQGALGVEGGQWEENLPWYLGGGMGQLFKARPEGCFDDLGVLDRAFLTLFAHAADTPPVAVGTIEVAVPVRATPAESLPPAGTSNPPAAVRLRVEIQNGCGIKGAADWAARRMEGPLLKVVGTGNAQNFRYPKTLVKTAAGKPVALEEALERLGVPPDSVEDLPTLSGLTLGPPQSSSTVDVLVIIGRDFRELKAKAGR